MKAIPIDTLDEVLTHPNIEVRSEAVGDETFERSRVFTVNGEEYRIEWWVNGCYLYAGDLITLFNWVRRSNTWPNRAKLNLQFYDQHDQVIAVLPIEYYPEQKGD